MERLKKSKRILTGARLGNQQEALSRARSVVCHIFWDIPTANTFLYAYICVERCTKILQNFLILSCKSFVRFVLDETFHIDFCSELQVLCCSCRDTLTVLCLVLTAVSKAGVLYILALQLPVSQSVFRMVGQKGKRCLCSYNERGIKYKHVSSSTHIYKEMAGILWAELD